MKLLLIAGLILTLLRLIRINFKQAEKADYAYVRLQELYQESKRYPGVTPAIKLKAVYDSRGRVLKQIGDILPKENRERFINDRIILAHELARLDADEAEIISDFEIIQQPYIQQ